MIEFHQALELLLKISDENSMKGSGPIDDVDEIAEDYELAKALVQKVHNEEATINSLYSVLNNRWSRRNTEEGER